MKIRNSVKQKRLEKGLSIRGLSERSGVSAGTIDKIENGLLNPTQLTMMKISFGLDEDTCEVFDLNWRQ